MIIFDDFLPDSELRKSLTKSSFWDGLKLGAPLTWVDRNKDPSNPIEQLSYLVWNEVVGIKENDVIYFDKNNSHQIEIKKEIYTVVSMNNVVVVL